MMYPFRNNCIAIPMDSEALRALHVVMLQHMITMGFHDTAKVFARETAITYPPPGFDEKYCFLDYWWGIFHDIYKNDGELAESSAEAEARAHVQAQAQVHNESVNTQAMVYSEAQAQARSQATALPLDQRQAQAPTHEEAFHARAMAYAEAPAPGHTGSQTLALPLDQALAQSWTFANNGVATPKHYIHPMGQSSVQRHPFCANNTNVASQPVLGVRWTDEQLTVLRQGSASRAYISNSRQNEQSSTQNSRQVRRKVNGPENEAGTGSASNGASTTITLATSQPPGPGPLNLDAV